MTLEVEGSVVPFQRNQDKDLELDVLEEEEEEGVGHLILSPSKLEKEKVEEVLKETRI